MILTEAPAVRPFFWSTTLCDGLFTCCQRNLQEAGIIYTRLVRSITKVKRREGEPRYFWNNWCRLLPKRPDVTGTIKPRSVLPAASMSTSWFILLFWSDYKSKSSFFSNKKSVHAGEFRGGELCCLGIQPYVLINLAVQFSFPSLFHAVSRVLIKWYYAAMQPLYRTFYLSRVSNEAFVEGAKRPSAHAQCFKQFFFFEKRAAFLYFKQKYVIRVNVNPQISINKFLYISQ